jgi:polyhydroxybutyrate depolymerase
MLPPGDHVVNLDVADIRREYLLYIPKTKSNSLRPVVFLLHGTGGTATWAMYESRFGQFADRHDFIAVIPQALPPDPTRPPKFLDNPPAWNAGGKLFPDHRPNDLGFFELLFDDLAQRAAIDPRRIYVTGFSNGASMTFELAVNFSDRIAAIAPVAGYCRVKTMPVRAVPTTFIIGTADPLVPPFGGQVTSPWTGEAVQRPPAMAGLDKWATGLGCTTPRELISEENGVRVERYPGSTECTLVIVDDLGHHWPGGRGQLKKKLAGEPTDRLDANEAIWSFFERQNSTS